MPTLIDQILDIASQKWVQSVFWALLLALATHIAACVAARALRHLLNRDSTPLPSSSIIINIVRCAIWIVGGSIILDACFGINVNAIVAALGVGGIAVSLGFQDTLSNLIGGLQVTFMRIVKPGDNIEVGAESGIVQDVTWRHTSIRDSLGQTVIIPNSIISKTALVHLLPASRVVVPFAIPRTDQDGVSRSESIDILADQISELALQAASNISPVIDGPRTMFSEISEFGIKGKIVLQVDDASKVGAAADAIVRSIAREL
ncbi:MAG: mechanosensitive ion channel [Collinsella sp.]|nr:mechanosensitive ion channel [Collinsella sp.]